MRPGKSRLPIVWAAGKRGFTLVEMLIVGALIAIFSTLAVFSIQTQFDASLRKATIGESRQIATALEFANIDTSVFPKLCFLTESQEGMDFLATQILGTGAFADLYRTVDTANRVGDVNFGARIQTKWNGPYFAMAQSRVGAAQGRGGFVYMLLPGPLPASGPNSISTSEGLRWPSDPYNNPYVVYMLDVVPGTSPELRMVTQRPPDDRSPTTKGNFVNAVVSYGPNRFPGGDANEIVDFGPSGEGDQGAVTAPGNGVWATRLYSGRPNYTPSAKGLITHTYTGYTAGNLSQKANMWSRRFAIPNGAPMAPSGIGIADPGSDDVVFEF